MKVGDKVKILSNRDDDVDQVRFPVGTIGTIAEDMSCNSTYCNPYRIEANG